MLLVWTECIHNYFMLFTCPYEKAPTAFPSYIRFLWPAENNRYLSAQRFALLLNPAVRPDRIVAGLSWLARYFQMACYSCIFPLLLPWQITALSPAITTWPGKMTMPFSRSSALLYNERHIFHAGRSLCSLAPGVDSWNTCMMACILQSGPSVCTSNRNTSLVRTLPWEYNMQHWTSLCICTPLPEECTKRKTRA